MSAASAISKLQEIESKSLAKHALTVAAQTRGKEWRGVAFRVGETELVASMEAVVEVLDPIKCTQVPSSEQWFAGIANIRGQLVPVSDFYSFIYHKPRTVDRSTRILVFKLSSSVIGVVVSAVSGIRNFPEDSLDQRYPELDDQIKPFVSGCFHRAGDDYPVFDFNRLVGNERFMHIIGSKNL